MTLVRTEVVKGHSPHEKRDVPRRDLLGYSRVVTTVEDWAMAMSVAERVRMVADWSLEELVQSEAREREHRGRGRRPRAAALAAASERAALAAAEKDDHMVELNAMTLVSMVSAVDALVEALVPTARGAMVEYLARLMMNGAHDLAPNEQALQAAEQEVQDFRSQNQLRASDAAPRGAGAQRWECVLKYAGMQTPLDRPIPEDLDLALQEIVELRHVLIHRAGRVDSRALRHARSLRYGEGELVRMGGEDYRRYSAALWTYGEEIVHRLTGDFAGVPSLQDWRENYTPKA
jgi:hypothetical protein